MTIGGCFLLTTKEAEFYGVILIRVLSAHNLYHKSFFPLTSLCSLVQEQMVLGGPRKKQDLDLNLFFPFFFCKKNRLIKHSSN